MIIVIPTNIIQLQVNNHLVLTIRHSLLIDSIEQIKKYKRDCRAILFVNNNEFSIWYQAVTTIKWNKSILPP